MGYAFDDGDFPVATMHLSGTMTSDDWSQVIADIERLLARELPCAVVMETSGLRTPEFSDLRNVARFLSEQERALERWFLGFCVATESLVIRGTAKAFLSVFEPAADIVVFRTVEEARAEAARRLESVGVSPS